MSPNASASMVPWNRRLTWYCMAALALFAILFVSRDKNIVDNFQEDGQDEDPGILRDQVGALTPHKRNEIRQISILGERNSGTRWTYAHLGKCFNGSLSVKRDLTRYKHWFQYRNASKYSHDTLVIAQFRNPYDWFEAMRHVPHHCPAHMYLDWQEFLTKEWTTERVGLDLEAPERVKKGKERCQWDFKYNDIISCYLEPLSKDQYNHTLHFSENQPFYEMRPDGSGKPFKNIMDMRAAKIRNFLEVKEYPGVADVWTVQYEYLLKKGTKGLLDQITDWTGIPYHCDPYEEQDRRKRPLTKSYAQFINENHDWSAEGLVGYTQEPV